MFSEQERDDLRQALLDRARADSHITGAAITGSFAGGTADRWSDIDLYFGVGGGATRDEVLEAWSDYMYQEHRALHHFNLHAGPATYRAFLLPNGLEVDLAFTPEEAFGARRATFQLFFGEPKTPPDEAGFDPYHIIGLAWHHVLHARTGIERDAPWLAEYWIHATRDHALTLACRRFGLSLDHGKGFDKLPRELLARYDDTLVHSLERVELERALGAVTARLLDELRQVDSELYASLEPELTGLAPVKHA